MMKDWTDIFAEELKGAEVPLPADDWDILRERHIAVQRRRKAVAWRWSVAVASAAAVLALVFLVFRSEPVEAPLYSEENNDHMPVRPDSSLFEIQPEQVETKVDMIAEAFGPARNVPVGDGASESPEVSEANESTPPAAKELHVSDSTDIDVIRDSSDSEKLIADSGMPAESYGDFLDDDEFADHGRYRRMKVSLSPSASGGLGGGNVIPRVMSPMPEPVDPTDTTGAEVQTFSPSDPVTKAHPVSGRSLRDTDWHHHMPVSFGISARFGLTDRFSVNTGLNYTMYASRRTRTYTDGSVENDMQNVHYLGIPLRCDWKIMDKRYLDMYIGLGGQVEKCIYAKVGSERLHEKELLWSAGVSLGLQYGISDRTALFFEPEITAKLNRGTLETYRLEHDLMLTARVGFRINL